MELMQRKKKERKMEKKKKTKENVERDADMFSESKNKFKRQMRNKKINI